MRQVARKGNDVVLHVTQEKTDVATRRDAVLLIAPLCKPFDNIRFATDEANEAHDFLPTLADLAKDDLGVFGPDSKNIILDCISLLFHVVNGRLEAINNVISE